MSPTRSLLRACTDSRGPIHAARSYVFGTLAEITIYGEDGPLARHLAETVLHEFDRLHWMLHAWQESDLVVLNRSIACGERDIPVRQELATLIRDATALNVRSGGLFNPAIGKLVGLWHFHASEFSPTMPSAAAIERALNADPTMLDLTVSERVVGCANRAVQLDFGGYAKGYALDRAIAILREHALVGALINAGGNIMALGTKGDRPWRVGIRHPRESRPIALLDLHDGEAISTSGDYERCFVHDGQRYCHIVDPRTGWPCRGTQSATAVVARRDNAGALSDASSGALFIAGADGWRNMAARLGVGSAMLIDERGQVHFTDEMEDRLEFVGTDNLPRRRLAGVLT